MAKYFGTLGAISGKYYYEVKISSANEHIGIASSDQMAKAGDSAGKLQLALMELKDMLIQMVVKNRIMVLILTGVIVTQLTILLV